MGQSWYYDFMNMNSALQQALIKRGITGGIEYIKDITSVKVSEFKYENIEKIPNLTSEILEMAMLFNMHLCFYKSPALGWVLCRWLCTSEFNEYWKPIDVELILLNGKSIGNAKYKDLILVRDNSMDIIPFLPMCEYIRKIEKIDSAIFKALTVATLPLAVVGSKKTVKTINETVKKLVGEEAIVAGDDTLVDSVKGFDINVRINPVDIYELKTKYKNECLASIGVYTVEEKRERKIVSEVASQNDYTDRIYHDMLTQRQAFVEALNKADPSLNIKLIETKQMIANTNIENNAKLLSLVQATKGGTKDDTIRNQE